ncbi:MAG TPA: hypothetical protein VGS11_11110 [Candidatus Bathyarchaeia archaeon]|nr:hypothetical protein [Candidatus Bathyarchaeia archaeon]
MSLLEAYPPGLRKHRARKKRKPRDLLSDAKIGLDLVLIVLGIVTLAVMTAPHSFSQTVFDRELMLLGRTATSQVNNIIPLCISGVCGYSMPQYNVSRLSMVTVTFHFKPFQNMAANVTGYAWIEGQDPTAKSLMVYGLANESYVRSITLPVTESILNLYLTVDCIAPSYCDFQRANAHVTMDLFEVLR